MVRRVSFILPKLAVCFGGKHSMENTQGLRLNIWEICIGFILLYFITFLYFYPIKGNTA